MGISRRRFGQALGLTGGIGGALGLLGCAARGLHAGSYTDLSLSGDPSLSGEMAKLRLPANFQPLQSQQIRPHNRNIGVPNGPQAQLKGDVVLDLMHMNFWAVSHAFALGETLSPNGQRQLDGLLLISRMADAQSFARPQAFLESAQQYSPDRRWNPSTKLEWKTQVEPKRSTFHEALPPSSGFAVAIEDREHLLEALYFGAPLKNGPSIARDILRTAVDSYVLRQPLDSYFRQVNAAVDAMAQARRQRYLELLETLQAEGLDYSPAPRVVRFNPNLVCRFYWPAYDRSGVPLEISFAARLGIPIRPIGEDLAGAIQTGQLILVNKDEKSREAELARAAGWEEESSAAGIAIAALSFSFTEEIPSLSRWLDEVEAASRQGTRLGLWAPPN
jgi:hypothetical protein